MKNIFRKTIQKVRNTVSDAFYAIKENPELAVLAAGAVISGVAVGVTIRQAKKEAAWLNNCVDVEDLPPYNIDVVIKALSNIRDAFHNGYENKPEDAGADYCPNLAKYGATIDDFRVMQECGFVQPDGTKLRLFANIEDTDPNA